MKFELLATLLQQRKVLKELIVVCLFSRIIYAALKVSRARCPAIKALSYAYRFIEMCSPDLSEDFIIQEAAAGETRAYHKFSLTYAFTFFGYINPDI